ncbi:Uncharacterised protein [Lactiplantibacillus plantarum subsp. plantarum]|nr:hypothetical protein [Lactiplantibacillus plantarum]SPX69683.1 Uncharacterised protein [Lactiplantibacillus plantarum subsp. plantarum]
MTQLIMRPRPGKIKLGLKASQAPAQLMDRLQYRPEVFEFLRVPRTLNRKHFRHLKQLSNL